MAPIKSVNSANIYSDFSKVNYKNNREFLSTTYGTRPRYYNTQNTEADKKQRKTSAIVKAILITGSFVGAGVAAYKNKAKLNQLLDAGVKKIQESGFYRKLSKNDFFKKTKGSLDNISNNFSNLKDDAYDSLQEKMQKSKFAPIKWIGEKLAAMGKKMSDVYYNILKDASSKEYEKAYQAMKEAGLGDKVDDYATWYKKLTGQIQHIHDNNTGNRITKGFFRDGKFREIHKKTFANELLNNPDLESLGKEIKLNNLTESQKKVLSDFNKIRSSLYDKLKPKIRDIAWGNAATDTLISAGSVIPLAWSIASADTKEERKDTVLNLGIPLLSGIAMNIFSTMKACSGAVGMIVGFVGGKILTTGISKAVDVLEKQKQNLDKEFMA